MKLEFELGSFCNTVDSGYSCTKCFKEITLSGGKLLQWYCIVTETVSRQLLIRNSQLANKYNDYGQKFVRD